MIAPTGPIALALTYAVVGSVVIPIELTVFKSPFKLWRRQVLAQNPRADRMCYHRRSLKPHRPDMDFIPGFASLSGRGRWI